MYKTCSICGRIHDINIKCRRNYPYQKKRTSDKFRSTYEWKIKREQIKKRDKYLCVACINNIDGTVYKYNYKDLQVHHIESIEEDYSKRLDSLNLITLCPLHHKKAENSLISKKELKKLMEEK